MSTPTTAAIDRRIKRSAAGWSDLPDDLVGIVLSRIGASPRDRVCFAAVCRAWREAAPRHPVPAAAPMLLLSPLQPARGGTRHLCGPAGRWAFRVPSKLAANKRFVGSHDGGWVAAVDDHELVIVNLFSGHQVPLSPQQSEVSSIGSPSRFWFLHHNNCKIIFSGDPASARGRLHPRRPYKWGAPHHTRCGRRTDPSSSTLRPAGADGDGWRRHSALRPPPPVGSPPQHAGRGWWWAAARPMVCAIPPASHRCVEMVSASPVTRGRPEQQPWVRRWRRLSSSPERVGLRMVVFRSVIAFQRRGGEAWKPVTADVAGGGLAFGCGGA
ncbi:hypothetical protein QYE76_007209 [Lolium multiflorum]|uniref:F-box domain-containing protein n=1 Tax=Lolium multiflorum TaxID=4521 RepID=A0AAD8RYM4_LOLMU|nr:hypothetical protein QYE76_007209 [Lolium multiflorum]